MSKKILKAVSVITVAIFVMTLGFSAFAEEFSDITGHWAEKNIIKWSDRGVIKGYDGAFHPDDNIIRGDMAVIINRVMNYPDKAMNLFFDLRDDEYYTDAVLRLNKAGIMLGDANYVRPDDYITREEAFVMFGRVYNFKGESGTIEFADKNDISDWAIEIICGMVKNGIINGSGDNKIHPKDYITRAEVITLLNNIEEKVESVDTENPSQGNNENVNPVNPNKDNNYTPVNPRPGEKTDAEEWNKYDVDFGEEDAIGELPDWDDEDEYYGEDEGSISGAVIGAEDTETGGLW